MIIQIRNSWITLWLARVLAGNGDAGSWLPSLCSFLDSNQWLRQRFFLRFPGSTTGGLLIPYFVHPCCECFQSDSSKRGGTNLLGGFRVGKQLIPLSHLQYADDTLIFLDGEGSQLNNLISLIHCFELVSEMRNNW